MKYVFCFSGGISTFYNYTRYQTDLKTFLAAILTRDGFSADRTTVLLSDGTTSLALPTGAMPTAIATKTGLTTALQQIAAKLTTDDMLIFFATNHGGAGETGTQKATLWCWNGDQITSDDFAAALATIKASVQVFVFGQCYSGGFVPSLTGPNRVVITACQFDEVSYATPDLLNDEFLLQFSTAVATGSATLRAAFQVAAAKDTQAEHPQLSDVDGLSDRMDVLGAVPTVVMG